MSALKRTHFGERLKSIVDLKFGTQKEFGRLIGKSEATISRWITQEDFARSETVRKALRPLRKQGINPEYFWNHLVLEYNAPPREDISESDFAQIRFELLKLQSENKRLEKQNDELARMVEELLKRK